MPQPNSASSLQLSARCADIRKSYEPTFAPGIYENATAIQTRGWRSPNSRLWAEVPTEPGVGRSPSHAWAAGTRALSVSPGDGRAVDRPFLRGSCNSLLRWWEVPSIPAPELPLALGHLALQALLFAVGATQRSGPPLPPPKMTGLCCCEGTRAGLVPYRQKDSCHAGQLWALAWGAWEGPCNSTQLVTAMPRHECAEQTS